MGTLDVVLVHLAAVLGHAEPTSIAADREFTELGIGSLSAVELRNRLAEATGRPLPATLIFDHTTPEAFARYLDQ